MEVIFYLIHVHVVQSCCHTLLLLHKDHRFTQAHVHCNYRADEQSLPCACTSKLSQVQLSPLQLSLPPQTLGLQKWQPR